MEIKLFNIYLSVN